MVAAFNDRVMAIAVGLVTAGPLDAAGVPSHQPERARLGALAREVVARLPERDPVLQVGGHTLQVRGFGAVLDGRMIELPPGPIAVLRELSRRPGHVVPRSDLICSLPGGGGGHAVEMAVTRLRAALGAPARRDRRQARLPPGDLNPLVAGGVTRHHAVRRRGEGSRP